jgi:hypothetical protein
MPTQKSGNYYEHEDPTPPQVTTKLDHCYILQKCLDFDEELGGCIREDDNYLKKNFDIFFIGCRQIKGLTSQIKQNQDQRNNIRRKNGTTPHLTTP